jgi:hypothetical protein
MNEEKMDKESLDFQDAINKNMFDYESILNMEEPTADEKKEKIIEEKEKALMENPQKGSSRSHVVTYIRKNKNIYRKAYSETQLLDVLGFNFKDGESYHCISAGDVDALSYLKVVLRQQDLEHCFISTWCMATDDILQIGEWLDSGKIKVCDVYVGEIFRGSYSAEYDILKPIIKKHNGRFVIFRNHAKIIGGYGKKFYFVTESSANVNTNPRAENTCLNIGKDIYDFYKGYFDKIISFEKEERDSEKG